MANCPNRKTLLRRRSPNSKLLWTTSARLSLSWKRKRALRNEQRTSSRLGFGKNRRCYGTCAQRKAGGLAGEGIQVCGHFRNRQFELQHHRSETVQRKRRTIES